MKHRLAAATPSCVAAILLMTYAAPSYAAEQKRPSTPATFGVDDRNAPAPAAAEAKKPEKKPVERKPAVAQASNVREPERKPAAAPVVNRTEPDKKVLPPALAKMRQPDKKTLVSGVTFVREPVEPAPAPSTSSRPRTAEKKEAAKPIAAPAAAQQTGTAGTTVKPATTTTAPPPTPSTTTTPATAPATTGTTGTTGTTATATTGSAGTVTPAATTGTSGTSWAGSAPSSTTTSTPAASAPKAPATTTPGETHTTAPSTTTPSETHSATTSTATAPLTGVGQPSSVPVPLPAAPAAKSRAAAPVMPTDPRSVEMAMAYQIGPEDVLDIAVWKNVELSRVVPVRPDGKVSLPLVNDIQAAGLTPGELRDQITQHLAEFIPAPEVSVMVREVHSRKVAVVGAVKMPGRFELRSPMTVLEAIALAQGLTDFASRDKITVQRMVNGKSVSLPFNYRKIADGAAQDNFFVRPGDVIIVP